MGGKIKNNVVYAHSKCCNAHWEVCYSLHDKRWFLACEKCEQEIGGITLSGPEIDGTCSCCGDTRTNKRG